LYEFYQRQVLECDAQIEAHLRTFADRSGGRPLPEGPKRRRKQRRPHQAHTPAFAARPRPYRVGGGRLAPIQGGEGSTGLVLLSELGTDMGRWASVKRFTSWLGLCPQHKISGGKVLGRKVRPGVNRAAQALRLAARALHHSQSALGAFFRRVKARLGAPK